MGLAASITRAAGVPATRTWFWWAVCGAGALIAAHAYTLTLPWERPNPLALADHVFALGLLAGLLWLSASLGLRLVRILGAGLELSLENLLFSVALGLGGLAYLVLGFGFVGLLHPWALALLLVVLAIGVRAELAELAAELPSLAAAWLAQCRQLAREPISRPILVLLEVEVVVLVLRTLAPPTGYDALIYHLTGPREFLRLGRLAPLPDLSQANFPFTTEMLYLLGLAFGSDELPSLLHASLAVLTTVATFSFGRRFFSPRVGWLAAAVFSSAPAVTFYAAQANVDFGWAYFDFLAVYAFAIWTQGARTRWLVMAGLAAGLSLGSKYLGILTFAALGLGILVGAVRAGRPRPAELALLLARFAAPAALIAAPWYLKNWQWLGSPVWPFLAPDALGEDLPYLVRNMNGGREPLDYLLLPLRLYLGGSVEFPEAIPPILFMVVPFYALVPKHRLVNCLLALAALHCAVWSQGIQALRYLFPVFPALSLAVAYVLDHAMRFAQVGRFGQLAARALLALGLLFGASMSMAWIGRELPFGQLLGLESRQAYLNRNLNDYGAIRYLNEHGDEVSRVLMLGDSRRFYVASPVVVDSKMDMFRTLAVSEPTDAVIQLREAGISHVLVSQIELAWATRFDPDQRVLRRWASFEANRTGYLTTEYVDNLTSVYRLADAVAQGSQP